MFSRIAMTALVCVAATACSAEWIIPEGYIVECTDNSDCPDSAECTLADDGASQVCVTAGETWCGNGVQEVGEACDDGDDNTGEYGTSARCNLDCSSLAPHCGDGEVNGGEECDSGENNSEEYGEAGRCSSTCNGNAPHCGDGAVNGGEACDLGDANSDVYGTPNGCLINCSGPPAYCGDQLTNGAESCDDGNTDNGDYCSSNCSEVTTICGDGQVQGDEVCDDGAGNTSNNYALNQTCNDSCSGYTLYCGDGLKNGSEACDDFGSTENGCTATCEKSPDVVCGDFITHAAFEGCDEGNAVTEVCDYGEEACTICDASCQVQSLTGTWCGDGIIQHEGAAAGSFEGCDGDVDCSELGLGTETATCGDDCMAYDTSSCSNQDMVFVPAGPFLMGCNAVVDFECGSNELPPHEVYLDSFLIDRTEVTAGDYKACVDGGGCSYSGGTDGYHTYDNGLDNHPINYVNHTDAKTYCEAQGKRLPTEAEWEKAARGTDGRKYPWGNSPAVSCTHVVMNEGGQGCGQNRTWEVGSKPLGVSPYGAHDMIGNVWEWTADWYDSGYYGQTPIGGWVNPEGPDSASYRVLRGGSFSYFYTFYLRASLRFSFFPDYRYYVYGFRCAQ